MTLRTFVDKNGNTWEWDETPKVVEALKNFHAGNYSSLVYDPNLDLKNETKTNTNTTNVG